MISVIIPTLNGRHHLERCLPAVTAQTADLPVEIIVVDNNSTDGTAAWIAQYWPIVRLLSLPKNAGYAGACNAGADAARGSFLVFLNNDTEPQPGWLDALHRALAGQPGAGLAGSHVVYFDGRTVDSAGDGYLRCGGGFKHQHGEPRTADGPPMEVFGACGAAMMIRRSLFEQLGGFDEDFFLVYEDVDLSYRARLRGATCLFVPRAVVLHVGSSSMGRGSALAIFHGQRNLEWTYIKNTPGPLLWRTLASHCAYSLAGGMGYSLRGHGLTWLRAKLAAVRELWRVLDQRRAIQASRRIHWRELEPVLEAGWITRKRREKRFALRDTNRIRVR